MEAYKAEQRRQEESAKLAALRKKIEQARAFAANDVTEGVPRGMVVDEINDEEVVTTVDMAVSTKRPMRKTKQQRARMEKQRAEVCPSWDISIVMNAYKLGKTRRSARWPRRPPGSAY
jgi:nucleolar protein 53